MSSATEADIVADFTNYKECLVIRHVLTEMGHPQSPTPVEVDNQCVDGILTDTIKKRRSKAMDMRFFWMTDRIPRNNCSFTGSKINVIVLITLPNSAYLRVTMRFVACTC